MNLMKNCNETWISTGTTVFEKDNLKENSAPYKQAVERGIKRNLGAAFCTQEIEKTLQGSN